MKEEQEIRDDEIRIIGKDEVVSSQSGDRRRLWGRIILGTALVVFIIGLTWAIRSDREAEQTHAESYFEEPSEPAPDEIPAPQWLGKKIDSLARGFTEIRDTVINDIPLRIYIPHNAGMTLHVGALDKRDTSIVFAAQAADIRRDNGKIVGAFVLKGEPLAWGLSKKGYCAVIDGRITIGVADNSPLFEEATEKGGYFFRQYPLVDNGRLVENEPKNKSFRRAICDREGEIFMVESLSKESFHDFAQALVDLGADQAIYLVGSTAYGWAMDEHGERHEFGEDLYSSERRRIPKYTSYVVWRRKQHNAS